MFTLYRVAFALAKPYQTGLLFAHKNGDFGEISETERRQPSPQALRFSHRRGGRETRGTMGRVQTVGEASPVVSFPPSFGAHFHRERDVWVRGRSEAAPRFS